MPGNSGSDKHGVKRTVITDTLALLRGGDTAALTPELRETVYAYALELRERMTAASMLAGLVLGLKGQTLPAPPGIAIASPVLDAPVKQTREASDMSPPRWKSVRDIIAGLESIAEADEETDRLEEHIAERLAALHGRHPV